MESAQRRPEKSTPWRTGEDGRRIRVIEVDGVQYTQWDHDNGPVRLRQQPPAQRQETPRYTPKSAAGARRTTATTQSIGDQPDHGRSDNYAPYPSATRPVLHDSRTLEPEIQAPPFSLFPRTETSQRENATPIRDQAQDMQPSVHPNSVRSGPHERGSKYYKSTRHGPDIVMEPAVTKRALSAAPDLTVRSVTRTSESTYSRTAKTTTSHLSELAQGFIEIPCGDYAACQEFMARHPRILEENLNDFQHEALRLQCDGKTHQVRSCVQQLLLLRRINKMSRDEPRVFFGKMRNKDPTTLKAFLVEFNKIHDALKAVAETRQPDSTQSLEKQSEPILESSHGRGQNEVPANVRHAPEKTRRPSIDEGLAPSMERLNVSIHNQQDSTRSYEAGGNGTRPLPATYRSSDGRRRRLSSVNEDSRQTWSISSQSPPNPPTVIEKDYDIRGDGSEQEELDHRYYVRTDGGKFFKIGRVFAMLWHEGAGDPKGGHLSNKEHFRPVKAGKYGERVYSHILRMAVVRVRHGYCWCIPIHTYNGRGVSKPGFNRQDQEAHAIIHMDDTEPGSNIPGEQRLMTKKPITVHAASPDQRLHTMSRLNFGAPYSIQMNVKVMSVGTITAVSMPAFESYWKNEMTST